MEVGKARATADDEDALAALWDAELMGREVLVTHIVAGAAQLVLDRTPRPAAVVLLDVRHVLEDEVVGLVVESDADDLLEEVAPLWVAEALLLAGLGEG